MSSALLKDRYRLDLVKVVQRLKLGILTEEYVSLDPVGQECLELVGSMPGSGHSEYIVKLFQSALFGFCKKV